MVGEGVLHECLLSEEVSAVLVVGRRPCGIVHPKVQELVHADLMDISPLADRLTGYDACFFCLGVSSVGMNEAAYTAVTHDLTLAFARVLVKANPDMTFCYISGAGTDGTEKGRMMWARVKGRTENELQRLGFRAVHNFRPPFMKPTPGLLNTLPSYRYVNWLYPLGRRIWPKGFITLAELGRAMIKAATRGWPTPVLEALDIVEVSRR